MMTLVVGGAASGKSEYAERLVVHAGDAPRIYIATMQPYDEESYRRIDRHRAMRAEKHFPTVERYTNLSSVEVPAGSTVLLECVSNLCANEIFSPEGSGDGAVESIRRGMERLCCQCGELIVVSNEVFSGGTDYEGDTLRYMRFLAQVNRELAAMADDVCEVACGLPVWHKGGERFCDLA